MIRRNAASARDQSGPKFKDLRPAITSVAYDTFWTFAAERQRIFHSRAKGLAAPWTDDAILQEYKFTNAYRASDRVSQYLIKNVIYNGKRSDEDTFFRIMIFKLFNKIGTWELLQNSLEEISWNNYNYRIYNGLMSKAMSHGATIYSAAYIMASGHKIFDVERKHQSHLKLIELMMDDSVPARIRDCKSMRDAFELLKSYPLIGDFLAYQLVTDINYSELTNFSEMEFTMPGPGAKDGIKKVFTSTGGLSDSEIIRIMADRQSFEFERLGIDFQDLWGRPLQLIDIQNLFCEVDKYCRVKFPNLAGLSGRVRIKQKFRQAETPLSYFYPPKWGI